MNWSLAFILNSELLGVGLAMDAFSVSLANGLNEPCMRKRKMCIIAGVFAIFQALMPMIGWVCVHTVAEHFKVFEQFIPWGNKQIVVIRTVPDSIQHLMTCHNLYQITFPLGIDRHTPVFIHIKRTTDRHRGAVLRSR